MHSFAQYALKGKTWSVLQLSVSFNGFNRLTVAIPRANCTRPNSGHVD